MREVASASVAMPTLVFTVLAALVVAWWLLSLVGLFDVDADLDLPGDADLPFGLADVPAILLASIVALVGWTVSVIAQLNLLDGLTGAGLATAAIAVAIAALIIAIGVVALLAPRLSRVFEIKLAHSYTELVGRVAEVRSTRVTPESGFADVRTPAGGTARVEIRALAGEAFADGDRVLLVDVAPSMPPVFTVSAVPAGLER